jgi:hypothetical protein
MVANIPRRKFLLGASAAVASGLGSIACSNAEQIGTALETKKDGGLPLSFDDPIFADVKTSNRPVRLSSGQSVVGTSIELPANDLTVRCSETMR